MRHFISSLTLLIFCYHSHAEIPSKNQAAPLTLQVTTQRLSDIPISKCIFGNFVELGFGRQGSGMWAELLFGFKFGH